MIRAAAMGVVLVLAGCGGRPLSVGGRDPAVGDHDAAGPGNDMDASPPGDIRNSTDHVPDGAGGIDHTPAGDGSTVDTPLRLDSAPDVGAGLDGADATPADASSPPTPRGCYSGDGGVPPPAGTLFGAPVTIDLPGSTAESVAIGDVTGDGRADVVVGAEDLIAVYPQTGSGALGPAVTYASGITGQPALEPRMLDLGDVNGDGRLDVVFTRERDVGVMLQNSSGGLDPAFGLVVTDAGNGEDAVAVGDLDGDGRADVVGGGWGGDGVDVWFQMAGGSLAPARHFTCPHGGYEDLTLGDLDGDGRLDIAISGLQQTTICVLLQRPGGFAPALTASAGSTRGLGIADVEGDCTSELIFSTGGNRPGSQVGIMELADAGGLAPPTLLPSYDIPGSLVVRDVDGDGRPDVVVNHEGWVAIGVYRQLPSGGLAAEERYAFSYINWGPDRIAVADINGDGRPDIVGVDAKVTILYHQ